MIPLSPDLLFNEFVEVKWCTWPALFAFNQRGAQCFELCFSLFQKAQPGLHNVGGGAIAALRDLTLDEIGEMHTDCNCIVLRHRSDPLLAIRHITESRSGKHLPSSQNASAGSSIRLPAPAWMRARWVAVSGSRRSMKKRPVTSLAFMRSLAPPLARLACAASTIRHHM
jgi:hypothetical protein